MSKEITKENMQSYVKTRIEDLTNEVNFQYGYLTKEEADGRLTELLILSGTFGLGKEEDVRKARQPIRDELLRKWKRAGRVE